jgi:hypothetical protein
MAMYWKQKLYLQTTASSLYHHIEANLCLCSYIKLLTISAVIFDWLSVFHVIVNVLQLALQTLSHVEVT